MKHLLYKFISSFPVILLLVCTMFAQTNSEQGIKLYNQGDFSGAIKTLKDIKEVKALYYLGLASEKAGESGRSKDAFKKSFAESYDSFLKKFIEWQKPETNDFKKLFSDLLQETKENNAIGLAAAEKAFQLKSDIFQTNEWRIKAKVLLDITNITAENEKIYAISDKSISDAKITKQFFVPFPRDSSGTPVERFNQSPNKPILIKVFIVFGTDKKIKLLLPVDDVIDAYTVQALSGFEKTEFQTATRNGKPVFYHAFRTYSFSKR